MRVERKFEICAAHRLMGYDGKCENLHGHNYVITLGIIGECHKGCNNGMFIDFKTIKHLMDWCTGEGNQSGWDHSTMLHHEDPLVPILHGQGQRVVRCDDNPTAENMVKWIAGALYRQGIFNLKEGVVVAFDVGVEETLNNTAWCSFGRTDFEASL